MNRSQVEGTELSSSALIAPGDLVVDHRELAFHQQGVMLLWEFEGVLNSEYFTWPGYITE